MSTALARMSFSNLALVGMRAIGKRLRLCRLHNICLKHVLMFAGYCHIVTDSITLLVSCLLTSYEGVSLDRLMQMHFALPYNHTTAGFFVTAYQELASRFIILGTEGDGQGALSRRPFNSHLVRRHWAAMCFCCTRKLAFLLSIDWKIFQKLFQKYDSAWFGDGQNDLFKNLPTTVARCFAKEEFELQTTLIDSWGDISNDTSDGFKASICSIALRFDVLE